MEEQEDCMDSRCQYGCCIDNRCGHSFYECNSKAILGVVCVLVFFILVAVLILAWIIYKRVITHRASFIAAHETPLKLSNDSSTEKIPQDSLIESKKTGDMHSSMLSSIMQTTPIELNEFQIAKDDDRSKDYESGFSVEEAGIENPDNFRSVIAVVGKMGDPVCDEREQQQEHKSISGV